MDAERIFELECEDREEALRIKAELAELYEDDPYGLGPNWR